MKAGHQENVDKIRVADRFKASAATCEHTAVVRKEISRQLVAIVVRYVVAGCRRVLETGCCTGVLTEYLCRRQRIDCSRILQLHGKTGCSLCRLGETHSGRYRASSAAAASRSRRFLNVAALVYEETGSSGFLQLFSITREKSGEVPAQSNG